MAWLWQSGSIPIGVLKMSFVQRRTNNKSKGPKMTNVHHRYFPIWPDLTRDMGFSDAEQFHHLVDGLEQVRPGDRRTSQLISVADGEKHSGITRRHGKDFNLRLHREEFPRRNWTVTNTPLPQYQSSLLGSGTQACNGLVLSR